MILDILTTLNNDKDVFDIRVNQTQVNAQGQRVGNNRPDIQYKRRSTGKQHSVEVDKDKQNMDHCKDIEANDPDVEYGFKIFKSKK